LVLDNADVPSSLVASLSLAVEHLKGQVDTVTTNGVRWGTQSVLVAALSHILELKSGCNADLIEDQADTL
jgi:ABC-type proline/glycine betaine transport system substrate-binding protein